MRLAALLLLAGLAKPPPVIPEPLLAACEGKTVGAPCVVNFGGTKMSGACVKLQDDTLACMQPRKGKR